MVIAKEHEGIVDRTMMGMRIIVNEGRGQDPKQDIAHVSFKKPAPKDP